MYVAWCVVTRVLFSRGSWPLVQRLLTRGHLIGVAAEITLLGKVEQGGEGSQDLEKGTAYMWSVSS